MSRNIRERQQNISSKQGLIILGLIWLSGIICDRVWFALDHSVPAWDQADYLNGALNYWHALQNPNWFNGDWWRSFWLISNKIPPLHYLLTAPVINIWGTSADAASLIMIFYNALLLISVYGLGLALFDINVGLWAAGLCQVLPGLYYYRLEFLLDYPLTAIVTFSFYLLTLWKVRKKKSWLLAIAFGFSFGLALLLKQTALFFLFIPIVWVFFACLKDRQWLRVTQLITAFFASIIIFFPWYQTNWLLILTSGKRATVDSAIAEGDPALNSLNAWTYYLKILPYLFSWHILIIPLVIFLLYLISRFISPFPKFSISQISYSLINTKWLIIYLTGGYLLSSLNINKDARYILPLLPVLALIIAIALRSYQGRWQKIIRWGTISLSIILMLLNIFPLGLNFLTNSLSPRVKHYPYTRVKYPNAEVVQEIIKTSPYLRSTLGVLPSTPAINQHNFSFYGGKNNFQVVGRQVGVRLEEVTQDANSLDWFLTKTGDQGSIPEAQQAITQLVETAEDFKLQKDWQLPDNSVLKLYYRTQPLVTVEKIENSAKKNKVTEKIELSEIIIPQIVSPGIPIPVTYQWLGNWEQLQKGIVLLTWQLDKDIVSGLNQENKVQYSFWLHDHGIGMGILESSENEQQAMFQVIENTAMLTPENIIPGDYNLAATYLDRETKETYPISIPNIKITINSNAATIPAPELDLVTQLRTIAPNMGREIAGLEPIFAQTARINQYDGKQDYLAQTELALSYRLAQDDITLRQRLDWTYAVGLAQVLQQDVSGAIASFKSLTELDSNNPYNYAYLAFVYLYDWHPRLAEEELNIASKINPDIPEVKTLSGVAAIMQGNLLKAWNLLR